MNNVMLDPLPSDWMGYAIDSDFRIGIQIHQILEDRELSKTEKIMHAGRLLFPGAILPPEEQAEALKNRDSTANNSTVLEHAGDIYYMNGLEPLTLQDTPCVL